MEHNTINEVTLFCPATVANVSCGFDVLGLCLADIGDIMVLKKKPQTGVRITKIEGADLPYSPTENVAGVAAHALLDAVNASFGVDIEIYKRIKAGSGIGSSAASASGAVFGVNTFLKTPLTRTQLIPYAMKGEELASNAAHADNVAPALLGGIALVRSYTPLDVITIPSPAELYVSVLHPQIELKTADARRVLKDQIPLKNVIQQCGNLAALISGLHTADYSLISRALEDVIAEPYRSALIPDFYALKKACINAGALGSGISGSGPSVFALSKGKEASEFVADAMAKTYRKTGIDFEIHNSNVNQEGIKILQEASSFSSPIPL